jgi:hypothetical protein
MEVVVKQILRPLLLTVLVAAGAFGVPAAAETNSAIETRSICRDAQLWAHTELYFGLSIQPGGTLISEEQYQQFIDSEVTPRFADGFTVLSGRGQFKNAAGVIVREPTKVLVIFYPFTRARSAAIDAIRAAYVSQFQQESVMRVDEAPACVGF